MRKATIIKTLKSLGVNDEYEINSPHEVVYRGNKYDTTQD
jgi:hypothetical protein